MRRFPEVALIRFAVPIAVLVALAGCGPAREASADEAWVRLPAAPGRPGAGYLTLHGGASDRTLLMISSPVARRIELHETMAHGRGTTMTPIAQLPVPAGATIAFAPGGKHLMLFDLSPRVRDGTAMPLTLGFADGRTLTTSARVIAAGDPVPTE